MSTQEATLCFGYFNEETRQIQNLKTQYYKIIIFHTYWKRKNSKQLIKMNLQIKREKTGLSKKSKKV